MRPSNAEGGRSSEKEGRKKDQRCKKMKQIDLLSELWLFLPHEINDAIIKRVPLEDLLRWRTVCKNWNRLILTELHPSRKFAHNLPLIVRSDVFSLASISAYNDKAREWLSIDLIFLLPLLSDGERVLTECRFITGGRSGLLFLLCAFRENSEMENSVIICNPLTKKSNLLKLPDNRRGGHVWVVCDDQHLHYKLLVSFKDDPLHSVYDSKSRSWSVVPGPKTDPYCIYSAVSHKGSLYYLRKPRFLDRHMHPIIGSYDPSSGKWSEILTLPVHIGPDSPRLVESGGHLIYVARTLTSREDSLSWCFFKKNDEGMEKNLGKEWEKIGEMPKDVYRRLNLSVMSAPIYREIRCIGEGDNMYFVGLECVCKQDGVKRLTNKGVKLAVVAHNVKKGSWEWLPEHVDDEARFWHWETNSIRVISFQPSLADVQ
ncbi:hypothetical protein MPTK2_8g00570 [Marchantia polymorpha subsp. ruderalis]